MTDTESPDSVVAQDRPLSALELIGVVGDVASAFLSNPSSRVEIGELPLVIENIAKSLQGIHSPGGKGFRATLEGTLVPAVAVKRSVLPHAIICLECARELKTMQRHLKAVHGLSPEQYLEKWGLPREYPLVAPAYAEHRSNLAKSMGLGAQRLPPSTPPTLEEPIREEGDKPAGAAKAAKHPKAAGRASGRAS